MVKSVLGVNHQGLRDWIIQRISALIMGVYSISLLVYLVLHPGLLFPEWHGLFRPIWMKIATILFLLSLIFHTWIGMWTIFTDYVKHFVTRCILNIFVLMTLAACLLWGVMMLWSL
jgi:succinate dehydrogenase / fumarate reductase, membrane anchor subunit